MFDPDGEDIRTWSREKGVAMISHEVYKALDVYLVDDPVIEPPILQSMGAKLVSVNIL